MSLVRVKGMWLNPEMVVGIWYERVEYSGSDLYWRVTLRADEGQVWQWKHPGEEDASRMCDELAAEVNVQPWLTTPENCPVHGNDDRPGGLR